jgi:hypothetical protein
MTVRLSRLLPGAGQEFAGESGPAHRRDKTTIGGARPHSVTTRINDQETIAMLRKTCLLLYTSILLTLPAPGELAEIKPQAAAPQNFALENGQWFNGKSFEARTVYSVNGRFTAKKPARVDRTLDLAGTWIVPPFGEAHNHNLNGIEERDRKAIQKYLADGVFYVKIQSNLPVTEGAIPVFSYLLSRL